MRLNDYIRVFRKRFWLILLSALVVAGLMYLRRASEKTIYSAKTLISVGGYIDAPNPDSTEIITGKELAQTYALLATTTPVLESTIRELALPLTVSELKEHVEAEVLTNTSLLRISVSYSDPVLAAYIANEVAQQLILHSPSNLTPEQQRQLDAAQAAIANLDEQIVAARAELNELDKRLTNGTDLSFTELERLSLRRNWLVEQINSLAATQAYYLNLTFNLQARSNSLAVVDPASMPLRPSNSSVLLNVVLGLVIGIGLAMAIAVAYEYFDTTVGTPEDVANEVQIPVLVAVPGFGHRRDSYPKRLITVSDPQHLVSERYRVLRARLLLGDIRRDKPVFVVTSPGLSEGKSVTAANLAVAMADANYRVLLIDANPRNPAVHKIFGLQNETGLTDLLRAAYVNSGCPLNMRQYSQETGIPGLRVMTSGRMAVDLPKILGSTAIADWRQVFLSDEDIDIVIFDTPPALLFSDSSVLAAAVQADALIVLRAGKTRIQEIVETKRSFEEIKVDIAGSVLNLLGPTRLEKAYLKHYHRNGAEWLQMPSPTGAFDAGVDVDDGIRMGQDADMREGENLPEQVEANKLSRSESVKYTSSFATNLGILIFSLVTSILLARLLGAEGRGEIVAAMLWTALLVSLGNLGMIEAITYFSARPDTSPRELFPIGVFMALLQSSILIPIGYKFMPMLLASQRPEIVEMSRAFLVIIPVSLITQYNRSLLQGQMRIGAYNLIQIFIPACYLIAVVALYALRAVSIEGIIALHICLNSFVFLLSFAMLRIHRVPLGTKIRWPLLIDILRYGLQVHIGSIFSDVNLRLDRVLLAAWVSPTSLGLYVVAVSAANVSGAFSQAVSIVAMPSIAKLEHDHQRVARLQSIFRFYWAGSIVIKLLFAIILPWAIPLVYGAEFKDSIVVAEVLLLASVFYDARHVLMGGARALGAPWLASRAEVIASAVTVVLLFVLLPLIGIMGAAITSLAAYGVAFGALVIGLRRRKGVLSKDLFNTGDVLRAFRGRAISFFVQVSK